jgi:hypothetical protein
MRSKIHCMCSAAVTTFSLAIAAGTANADSITASLFSPQAPNGSTPTVVDLTGITVPSDTTLDGTGYTIAVSVGSG